jgi:peptidoglycan/xylan/chitin deacetylase (PgdA/CDA1 family)
MTAGGAASPRIGERRFRPLVLCYHAVSDTWADPLAVRPAMFERQVRSILRRGYRPASATEALSGRGRLVHVTFDDAYRSVMAAMPALDRLGVPATVFACTNYANDGRPLDIPELAIEAGAHPGELATMSWDQLRSLVERKVEIGSHTRSHAHLRELADSALDDELRGSRERLEDELGVPCRYLAYPFGEHDARVRSAAREAGYEAAFALPGPGCLTDVYDVPRVGLWRKDGVLRATIKTTTQGRRLARGLRPRSRFQQEGSRPGVRAHTR